MVNKYHFFETKETMTRILEISFEDGTREIEIIGTPLKSEPSYTVPAKEKSKQTSQPNLDQKMLDDFSKKIISDELLGKKYNDNISCSSGETLLNGYCISDELAGFIIKKDDKKPNTKIPVIEKEIPASFVDESKDSRSYVKRYVTEPSYKTWFEENYPDYTFYEAIGITKDQFDSLSSEVKDINIKIEDEAQTVENISQKSKCGSGTHLENGICIIDKQEVQKEKQEKDYFTKFLDMLKSLFS